jgi:hypothetical protein
VTSLRKIDYDSIELTQEELIEAIREGKKKKYFYEKNKHHWPDEENIELKKPEKKIK